MWRRLTSSGRAFALVAALGCSGIALAAPPAPASAGAFGCTTSGSGLPR
jgi:hypothetical protein